MHRDIGSKSDPSPSRSDVNRKRQGVIALAVQLFLVLVLASAVVGALVVDSRLYYGIDVDGQPLHQEQDFSGDWLNDRTLPPETPLDDTLRPIDPDAHVQHTPERATRTSGVTGNTPLADG